MPSASFPVFPSLPLTLPPSLPPVQVKFSRAGLPPPSQQELLLTRRLIRVPDVKLTSFLGPPKDGIGYVQLGGFSQNAPTELRIALESIRLNAPEGLKGLVLDLRGNPGGLLTSAVDVASLLVPPGSEIVSVKGRAFPAVSYSSSLGEEEGGREGGRKGGKEEGRKGGREEGREGGREGGREASVKSAVACSDSRVTMPLSKQALPSSLPPSLPPSPSLAPIRDSSRVPLAVLVNSNTASAAEIVSGAVQDLDSGVIVGEDRTYGKGLVQNVEPLPFKTALKYTVAKYYTPSGTRPPSLPPSLPPPGSWLH